MKHRIGSGFVAVLATASIVLAGGDGEKKGEGEKAKKSTRTLETLANRSTPQGATTLTAKAGEGFTIDAGEEFSLNVRTLAQVRWTYSNFDLAPDVNNFNIPRARMDFSGHVQHRDVTYRVQIDLASNDVGDGLVRDAWGRWGVWTSEDETHSIGLRFGAQKPMHGREFTGRGDGLEHIKRSIASRIFSGNRVVGFFADGTHLEGDKLHWTAGAANNDVAGGSVGLLDGSLNTDPMTIDSGGANFNGDNEINFITSLRFDPWGDMGAESYTQGDLGHTEELLASIGSSVMVGNGRTAAAAPDIESQSININAAAKMKGFSGLAEVFIRSDDVDGGADADSIGWNVSGSYTLPKPEDGGTQWGGALRVSQIDFDDPNPALSTLLVNGAGSGLGAASGEILEVTATLNAFYHEHNMKSQLSYTWQNVDPDVGMDADNSILEVQFQLAF